MTDNPIIPAGVPASLSKSKSVASNHLKSKTTQETKKSKPAKYTIIKQYICEHIESGQWPQNAKVPSENELAQQFSVSRMTARRALQELTEQGILVRSQGSGTFVATFKSQSSLLKIRNISDEISERGHQHQAKQLLLTSLVVTEEIAILLNLKSTEQVYYSEILHYENNEAIQLEQRYVNASLIPEYLSQDFTLITPHEYLSAVAPLTEATHEVEAILASEYVCQLLAINTSKPCLQVKRRTWSKQGVVSVATLTSPGDKYRLGSHLIF